MNIVVNAERHRVEGETLAQILEELGFTNPAVATAVNGSFVPRPQRPEMRLRDGDRVEVLAPMQGG